MKARNNKTGEIVTDFAISKEFGTISYFDSNRTLRLTTACDNEWTILDEESPFDWLSFRAEAAKDFTVAILSNPRWSEHFKATDKDSRFDKAYYKKVVIGNALSYTDELIKQLKEKEEKL